MLKMSDTATAPYFIIGIDAKGVKGAQLAAGQLLKVISNDTATVVLTPDATPQPAPDGTPTLASGVVSSPATVAQPRVPINVTASVTNADGSAADAVSDTVEIDPDVQTSLGELFGTGLPVGTARTARK